MEQPFRGKGGGQKIGEMEVWALQGWNARHILQEALTFKSSDLHGRDEVMRFLRGISEVTPTSKLPEATKATFFYLRGLGLDVLMYDALGKKLEWASPESDIDVDNISKVQIKFTTDEERRAFAKREAWEHPSEITTTEIFESGKQIYAKNGLFSEQIFGSLASHQCQCGNLRFPWEKGKFCPNCEVMVGSFFRRHRMGYIELACECINPLLFQPTKPIAQQIEELDRSREKRELCFIKYLPVIPPDLRPRITTPSGRAMNHDISQLYLWVLRANENYKKVARQKAPKEEELQKKREYLQRAVNRLFMNGDLPRWEQATKKPNQQPLSGLLDQLSGKQGAFRGNLLGTRVDWSARAVIAVDPNLELHQCGLPWLIALLFFRNQVEEKVIESRIEKQEKKGGKEISPADKRAIRITVRQEIEKSLREETISKELFAQLEHSLRENPTPILLNRQPSLHRLSIQAFLPVPTRNYTISLHPLVCSGFGADFDGDTMACYLPITDDAKKEAQSMVDVRNYLLSPASGDLVISISQDISLGIYYLTLMKDDGISHAFDNFAKAIEAHEQKTLSLHQKIIISNEPLMEGEPVQTTVGRIILYRIFPDDFGFDKVNKTLDRRELKSLLKEYHSRYYPKPKEDPKQFFTVFDKIRELGFYYATMSGCTFSVFELPSIEEKSQFIADGEERVSNLKKDLTEEERLEEVRKIWGEVNEQINEKLSEKLKEDRFNSFSLMIHSGARGDINQLSQLCCMRGLMSKLGGGIVEEPVTSSFLEGMSLADYLLSTHASRKSLGDKGLSPAHAGYLMRRMVEAIHDVLITEDDCQKNEEPPYAGLLFSDIIVEESGRKRVLIPVEERLIGRNLAETLQVSDKEYPAEREIDDEFCKALLAENTVHWSEGGDMSLVGLILQQDVVCKNEGETISKGTVVDSKIKATLRALRWENINLEGETKSYYGRKIAYIPLEGKEYFIGKEFNAETAQSLKTAGVKEIGLKFSLRKPFKVKVRTPLTCKTKEGICRACYGKDLATNETVSLGMPVGIIAAQSIGEPGTQLSMRTFHTGGKAGDADITQGIERVESLLEASDQISFLQQNHGRQAVYDYLITELQNIYRGAKATINDKHFETLFRKMVQKDEKRRVTVRGLSQIAKNSSSWLAASSFQETRRRLVERALRGETDELQGLKENVILGRKI
jgi:DNA-directed RNA polymerase subunit beta'